MTKQLLIFKFRNTKNIYSSLTNQIGNVFDANDNSNPSNVSCNNRNDYNNSKISIKYCLDQNSTGTSHNWKKKIVLFLATAWQKSEWVKVRPKLVKGRSFSSVQLGSFFQKGISYFDNNIFGKLEGTITFFGKFTFCCYLQFWQRMSWINIGIVKIELPKEISLTRRCYSRKILLTLFPLF